MKITSILGFTLAIAAGVISGSCKEEDTSPANQTVDLIITAYDPNTESTIPNATVVVINNGKKDSIITNSHGSGLFHSVKIGSSIPVTVKAEGYTRAKLFADVTTSDYRQSQYTVNVNLYALFGPSTATVRGKAEIETDLTNTQKEKVPAGIVITALINPDPNLEGTSNEVSITTTVDASGNYSLTVPTSLSGMPIKLVYPDLELDQKIAINRVDEQPSFPKTSPSLQTIKTVFSTSEEAIKVPIVAPIFALVNGGTSPAGAVIYRITPENKLEKWNYGVNDENGGSGFSPTATIPSGSIVVTSLLGQTTVAKAAAYSNNEGKIISIDIIEGGAGYPTQSNVNISKVDPTFPLETVSIKSGDIKVFNINYGTGTSRAKDIQ
ncbi:MAG: hypothetical protein WKF87_19510 [Chryseolinea sp.]